jgi:hypothetical protein
MLEPVSAVAANEIDQQFRQVNRRPLNEALLNAYLAELLRD